METVISNKVKRLITAIAKNVDNYDLLQDIQQELYYQWLLNQARPQPINEFGNPNLAKIYLTGRLKRLLNKEYTLGITLDGRPQQHDPWKLPQVINYGLNPEPLFHIQTKKHKPQD